MAKPKLTENEQKARFIEAARKLECDEDKDRFEEKLGKLAGVKPAPENPPRREKRR
jgi:hypothetical protein